jgi:hypothetical protein
MDKAKNLAEYNISDIISRSWQLLKDNFQPIVVIILVVYIPINIILRLVQPEVMPEGGEFTWESLEVYWRIIQVLEALIGVLAVMAITWIVFQRVSGNNDEIDFKDALGKAFSKWGVAVGTSILAGVMLMGLYLLFIVPGIIFSVFWVFVIEVVIVKDLSFKKALDYSKSVVKGRWWKTIWYSIVLSLFSAVIIFIGALPFLFTPDNFFFNIIGDTWVDVIASFFIVIWAVMFLSFDASKLNDKPKGITEDAKSAN